MKRKLILIIITGISFVAAAVAYFFLLPQNIPVQFTTEGIRYMDKAYIFIFALIPPALYLGYIKRH